ncbi:glyoxalase [candidate division WOR_3 bacterium SM23_42]|uniref:Glyoxalase n=1 Tax=candidate division WOR_3 bacterium SM23_42 TaxID=1703779 RepID=A0A0S8FTH2_UNCW3|nr:MAG: glyoxalase [candidate division WOR_3 bacterium SM23_42]
MAGIVFLKTQCIEDVETFYTEKIDMQVWLRQGDCIILKHENLLIGFCKRSEVDRTGTITFFYDTTEEVDIMYDRLKNVANGTPRMNEKYRIYQFYAHDPEERILEFQCFLDPVRL